VIAALILLAQMTPVPAEPAPVETTIAAIRANPKKFDGQLVRLHGYVNSCAASACAIDERAKAAPGGPGEELSVATNQRFDELVRPIVPTYVEFDGRVDAACVQTGCPVLTVVTLRGVVSPEPPPFGNP
jgi:hypothetical protein